MPLQLIHDTVSSHNRFGRAYTPSEAALARQVLPQALQALGKDNFFINIHGYSLPAAPNSAATDIGSGSPYSQGSKSFFNLAADEGFNGQVFQPQGYINAIDPNPYRGKLFSRNVIEIDYSQLDTAAYGNILPKQVLSEIITKQLNPKTPTTQTQHPAASAISKQALKVAFKNFSNKPQKELKDAFNQFVERNTEWLSRDALFEILSEKYHPKSWQQWPTADRELFGQPNHGGGPQHTNLPRLHFLEKTYQQDIKEYAFAQFIAEKQHHDFRQWIKDNVSTNPQRPFQLVGDIQIGVSDNDEWAFNGIFMDSNYRMAAPPSKTGPTGQPWAFPVINPKQLDHGGKDFIKDRITHVAQHYDMLRFDHPHGWIDPWVYKHNPNLYKVINAFDPKQIQDYNNTYCPYVQKGARMFASHDPNGHPYLKQFMIPTPAQLKTGKDHQPYYDEHVLKLSQQQVDQYNQVFKIVVEQLKALKIPAHKLVTEVLSTCPNPVWQVMQHYGLGRCRVIQKADPSPNNPKHVYRPENAQPNDWVMTSTHDSPSLWNCLDDWFKAEKQLTQTPPPKPAKPVVNTAKQPTAPAPAPIKENTNRAEYLAWLLATHNNAPQLAQQFKQNPGDMANAFLAAALTSKSKNIILPFVDVFGLRTRINNPETPSPQNWTLRLPETYAQQFEKALQQNNALNIPAAMAMALKRRQAEGKNINPDLIAQVEQLAAIKRA